MLLRAYRITDKLGILLIKIATLSTNWALRRSDAFLIILRHTLSTLLAFLMTILTLALAFITTAFTTLLTLVKTLLRWAWQALKWLLQTTLQLVLMLGAVIALLVSSLLNRTRPQPQSAPTPDPTETYDMPGYAADTLADLTQPTTIFNPDAVPTANLNTTPATTYKPLTPPPIVIDPPDKKIMEDPLRVQNRRLSLLVLVMGIIAITALLYATDPNRNLFIAPTTDERPVTNLFLDETPIPTEEVAFAAPLASPIPTATRLPVALQIGGNVAYTVREQGQTDIWALNVGTRDAIRLTNAPQDERDAVWSPDGSRLAYASRQDGNWEIYVYDLPSQTTQRLTFDLSFQGRPTWSPDGLWLAYESYQGANLDIYAVPLDASETPIRITDHPTPDFSPAWSPGGREIAFVSWRDGNQDIYIFSLDTLEITNLTQTPDRNEDFPAWAPDGERLAFSAFDQGAEKVFVMPVDAIGTTPETISFGRTPTWSPDGASLAFIVDATDRATSYLYAVPYGRERAPATEIFPIPYGSSQTTWSPELLPPALVNAGGLPPAINEPLFVEQFEEYQTGAPYRLNSLLDVETERPFLSDRVNDSFNALRQRLTQISNVDLLQRLDDAWWDLERRPEQGQPRRNWHMTGRAFAITRNSLLGFPPQIEIIRENIGTETFWRVFVRVDEDTQNGQFGEPLRQLPWDLLSRTQGDIEAYNQGGRTRQQIPTGYYVDLTQLASDYGWQRLPASSDWRANVNGINYAIFIKSEGLDWYSAMREIHTEGELVNFAPTPTPAPLTTSPQDDES